VISYSSHSILKLKDYFLFINMHCLISLKTLFLSNKCFSIYLLIKMFIVERKIVKYKTIATGVRFTNEFL